MTQQDYEKLNQQCWEKFRSVDNPRAQRQWFNYAFDRAYALGKQENDADTVISGWVARDADTQWVYLYSSMPTRGINMWDGHRSLLMPLDSNLFPDLTWDDEPQEVEIIIKRKRKNL